MDPSLLPDQELIKASQSGAPGIPSWLALSTLQSRNQQRASAPVQAPQGTVASDVVAQALKGIGFTPQAPQQSPTDAPQPSGIMAGAQPSSFAKGGPVRFAEGGQADGDNINGLLEGFGIAPKATTITPTPTTYNPAMAPDTGDLDSAVAKIGKLYGPAPDYAGQSARIDQNAARGQQKYNVGSYLQDMVAGILGGKSVSPTNNFGTALAASDAKQRGLQQQNFENDQAAEKQRIDLENRQFDRQKAIAQSAEAYHSLNVQMADSQAREKAEIEAGNNKGAQDAAEKTAELANQRSSHLMNAAKLFSDAGQAQVLGRWAKANGNLKLASFATDAADAANAQTQKDSDIKQKAEMAVQAARSAASMKEMRAKESIQHGYKMQELGMSADGNIDIADPSSLANLIATYKTHPLSPMSLTRPQAKVIMSQVMKINPDFNATYYDPIQAARKETLPNGKIKTNVDAANTAVAHLDLLDQYGQALGNKDMQAINSLKNKFGEQMGNPAPTNFDGVKHQVAGELVGILKKNGIADQDSLNAVNDSMKKISSPQQLSGFIDSQMQVMGGKIHTVRQDIAALPGIPKDDPLHSSVDFNDTARKVLIHRGYDPDDISKGKVLAGLPAGNGKKITDDQADQFFKVAGNDPAKAKKLAYDFGFR